MMLRTSEDTWKATAEHCQESGPLSSRAGASLRRYVHNEQDVVQKQVSHRKHWTFTP